MTPSKSVLMRNKAEDIDHDSVMLSLVFISQIEEEMEKQNLTRAELSRMVGASKSYFTQLWRGDKVLNMEMIAKIQIALKIKFTIKATAQ